MLMDQCRVENMRIISIGFVMVFVFKFNRSFLGEMGPRNWNTY